MVPLRERILQRLLCLRSGTTICPGQLARDCGTTLPAARLYLLALALEGRVVLSQRGKIVSAEGLKGPFRVRLPR